MDTAHTPKVYNTSCGSMRSFTMPSEPLYKRVPLQDVNGNKLADFMIILPGLKQKSSTSIESIVERIRQTLEHYSDVVVFADLNISINLLWVSFKPRTGLRFEIASALQQCLPQAKLVAYQ